MKTKLYLSNLFFLLFTISIFAQYDAVDRFSIDEREVPSAVINAQRNQFLDGFVTEWKLHNKNIDRENDLTHYMAIFKKDGRQGNRSYYSTSGDLLAYVVFINSFDIPETIQIDVKEKFEKSKIKAGEFIDLENPKREFYRIKLNNDGLLQYIYYDKLGRQLQKRNLPIEIFSFI
jgi:hypothetical protein